MKNYIILVRDHSNSMQSVDDAARNDYNATIESIKAASLAKHQDTQVSVIELGYENTNRVRTLFTHKAVTALEQIPRYGYSTNGYGTPLYDAIGQAIYVGGNVFDLSDPTVSFLVLITTDGQENASVKFNARDIAERIKTLQNTDRWTFVFRVPKGDKRGLVNQGIPEGNIIEWDRTRQGVETAQQATTTAFDSYFTARSKGQTSTRKFYANLDNVTSAEVEGKLVDISKDVLLWPVSKKDDGAAIKPFVEGRLKRPFKKGTAFYQLTKSEEVQEYKEIVVRDKTTNAIYGGSAAKHLLGLPLYERIRLAPARLGNFDVFIQSTSVNRKLVAGTQVLYWEVATGL